MENGLDNEKPRFYVSHDQEGLFLWLAKRRPQYSENNKRFVNTSAVRIRLPYSWFGHMIRENRSVEIDVEAMVIHEVNKKARRKIDISDMVSPLDNHSLQSV